MDNTALVSVIFILLNGTNTEFYRKVRVVLNLPKQMCLLIPLDDENRSETKFPIENRNTVNSVSVAVRNSKHSQLLKSYSNQIIVR